ncbi:MAG TPA: TIGR02996 domain-containing protein, partial [Planctomycetaceae bacterium]|nr:TIGR02996 domain-containing protein [Planctomycetaceae bacterium]
MLPDPTNELYLKFVNRIRQRPWDAQPLLDYAEWLDDIDKPRAELIRVQIKLDGLTYEDSEFRELCEYQNQLFADHKDRWLLPLKDLDNEFDKRIQLGLIDAVEIVEATDDQVACLTRVPELRELTLSSPQLTDEGFRTISRLPNLDSLTINSDDILNHFVQHLERLPPWTVIRCYTRDLDKRELDAMNTRRIGKFKTLSTEEQFGATARFLATFSYGSRLSNSPNSAYLSQAEIRDPEMLLLGGIPDLETIYISDCHITSQGIQQIAGITQLRELELWSTCVDSIASLKGLTNLEKLCIFPEYETKMGDDGFEGLQNFIKLREIYLNDRAIGDQTVRRLAPLTQLRKAQITVERLDDEDSLAALASLTCLETLGFHGPNISDAALTHLSKLESLKALYFGVRKGTGEGFKHLVGLTKLKLLSVYGKGVTDLALSQLAGLSELGTIMAQGTAVSKPGAEWLAARLPEVTIILDECVVKSPRKAVTFNRARLGRTASLLFPEHWSISNQYHMSHISAKEDGWQEIGGWSGLFVAPAEIQFSFDHASSSANDAMMASIKNAHMNPKILLRDVVTIGEADETASCIYQNDGDKYLVLAATSAAV